MNQEFSSEWQEPAVSNPTSPASASHTSQAQKQIVTIRLDIDMLNWFKAAGPGYQTRINQILREYMQAQQAGK